MQVFTKLKLFIVVLASMWFLSPAQAEAIYRVKAIPFPSVTMSDSELLQNQGGTPVEIAGVLRLPAKQNNPVIVILHGSSGYLAFIDDWVQRLNDLGYGTFVIDSFSGRGLDRVADKQALLGRLSSIRDAYAALDRLSHEKGIDPNRIALMGFSRGGQGALYASMQRFAQNYAVSQHSFAGFVAFYPNCSFRYQQDDQLVARPIRIFHGEADDFNAFKPCQQFVERAHSHGADISINGYPGAYHAFDFKAMAVKKVARAQSVRDCDIQEEQTGVLINQATNQPFSYADQCVRRGVYEGYNQAAGEDVVKRVPAFFKTLFRQ